ncbi:hypothetical protein CDAR_115351 [Caerostris darwini]|uniref:Uncharacterized protein n=1 Tax=Caerostris darwini TaxID=1538125 RepID=A0AAV4U9Z1_9ARAC|nr:hypothetical protein CDAR_115351 [Caerostris darwini]
MDKLKDRDSVATRSSLPITTFNYAYFFISANYVAENNLRGPFVVDNLLQLESEPSKNGKGIRISISSLGYCSFSNRNLFFDFFSKVFLIAISQSVFRNTRFASLG